MTRILAFVLGLALAGTAAAQGPVVTGVVHDLHGIPMPDVPVFASTDDSTASRDDGTFRLGPLSLAEGETLVLRALLAAGENDFFDAAPVRLVWDGSPEIRDVVLRVEAIQEADVTLQGTVSDTTGAPVDSVWVRAADDSVLARGGAFLLSGVTVILGEELRLIGTRDSLAGELFLEPRVTSLDGLALVLAPPAPAPRDTVDLAPLHDAFQAALRAEYTASDRVLTTVEGLERLQRELGEGICRNSAAALLQADLDPAMVARDAAGAALDSTYEAYRAGLVANGVDPVDAEMRWYRSGDRSRLVAGRVQALRDLLADLGCPVISAGGGAAGSEVCGDGLDNDADGQIDECDAGCCLGATRVVIRDAGARADDVFTVTLDTGESTVTEPGEEGILGLRLPEGPHWVKVKALRSESGPATYRLEVRVDGALLVRVIDAIEPGSEKLYLFDVSLDGGPPPEPLQEMAPAERMAEP